MTKPTIKELLMALPNKKRLEIWGMLLESKSNAYAYSDYKTIENQYDPIILEVELHLEVE